VLNEGLPGKLLTTTAHKYGSYFGKVFEFELSKGSYNIIFPDGVAAENLKGEILYFDKTSRIKITDKTGNTTIKQLSDKVNYNFDDYYPAISSSGEYVALTIPNKSKTGTLADLVANGVKLLVADRNGQGVGEFKGYTQAAWMSDGRIVVAGDGDTNKGLFIIDAKFKSIKKLFEGFEYAKMPAVSPDSKTIAFSNKGEIWTINIDGTNPVKAVFGNESNFPAWSPDGKYLAVNVLIGGATTKCLLYIVNLKLNKGFYVKDSNGNNVESWNRITWLP
jgi:tricorn protease-like protein